MAGARGMLHNIFRPGLSMAVRFGFRAGLRVGAWVFLGDLGFGV